MRDTTSAQPGAIRWSEYGASRQDSSRVAPRAAPAARPRTEVIILAAEGSGHDWLSAAISAHPHRPLVQHADIRTPVDAHRVLRAASRAATLHLIRDGRNVIASAALPRPAPPSAVRQLAARWARSVHAIRTARHTLSANLIEVRIERLHTGAAAHTEHLLESLGLPALDPPADLLPTAPTSPTWRDVFTNDAKAAFKSTAGALLIELGYERDMEW